MAEADTHILIVDDDEGIRTLLQKFLRRHNYRTSLAADAKEARAKMAELNFDLLVLDVMMPGESGLELAESLRKNGANIPILVLTARGEPVQRVEGLRVGVDDYMPKPFEPQELLLRLKNILRHHADAVREHAPSNIRFGEFTFTTQSGRLQKGQSNVSLTTSEVEMLRCFAKQRGKIVSRAELSRQDSADMPTNRSVDVQINRLRRKIEADPSAPLFLQTVRGAGYILHIDE